MLSTAFRSGRTPLERLCILAATAAIALACAYAMALPQSAHAAQPGDAGLAAGAATIDTQSTVISGDWEYSRQGNNTAKIVQYRGTKSKVSIPSKVDGRTVTAISNPNSDSGIFGDYYDDETGDYVEVKVTSVTIPATVKVIGFMHSRDTASDTGVKIKHKAMRDYTVGSYYLQTINVAKNNPYFKSMNGVLFNKKGTRLCSYPAGKKRASYTVPASVKVISQNAFSGARVKTVTLSKALRTIEPFAFSYSGVRNVNFRYGIKSIGNYAFYYADQLRAVELPKSATSIGVAAFAYNASLRTLKLNYGLRTIGNQAFYFSGKLATHEVLVTKSVKKVGDGAFTYFDLNSNDKPMATFKVPKKTTIVKNNFDGIDAKKLIRY